MIKPLAHVLTMLALLALTACSTPRPANEGDVQKLAIEIQALGPEIDPQEAQRAARVAYAYTAQLAQEYQITDPPLIHRILSSLLNSNSAPLSTCRPAGLVYK